MIIIMMGDARVGNGFQNDQQIKAVGERAQRIQLKIDYMFIFSEYYSRINAYLYR